MATRLPLVYINILKRTLPIQLQYLIEFLKHFASHDIRVQQVRLSPPWHLMTPGLGLYHLELTTLLSIGSISQDLLHGVHSPR